MLQILLKDSLSGGMIVGAHEYSMSFSSQNKDSIPMALRKTSLNKRGDPSTSVLQIHLY